MISCVCDDQVGFGFVKNLMLKESCLFERPEKFSFQCGKVEGCIYVSLVDFCEFDVWVVGLLLNEFCCQVVAYVVDESWVLVMCDVSGGANYAG